MVPEEGSPLYGKGGSPHNIRPSPAYSRVPSDQLQLVHSPALQGWPSSHLLGQSSMQQDALGQKILRSFLLANPATTLLAGCCGSVLVTPHPATTMWKPFPAWCCGSGLVCPLSATTPGKSFPLECCGSELVSPPWAPGGWHPVKYLSPSDGKLVGGWCTEVCPHVHHLGLSQLVMTEGRGNASVSTPLGARESPLGARAFP